MLCMCVYVLYYFSVFALLLSLFFIFSHYFELSQFRGIG